MRHGTIGPWRLHEHPARPTLRRGMVVEWDRPYVGFVAGAALIFVVCVVGTRPPPRRLVAVVAGGLVFAVGNVVCDVWGADRGWWWYPPWPARGYATPWLYAAAGLGVAGVSLLGWR